MRCCALAPLCAVSSHWPGVLTAAQLLPPLGPQPGQPTRLYVTHLPVHVFHAGRVGNVAAHTRLKCIYTLYFDELFL